MTPAKTDDAATITVRDERIPAIGFGTWQLSGDACLEGVKDALALGYRHIDTAQMYENEHLVGEAIAASGVPRDEVFLVTKVGPPNAAEADAIRSTDESLRNLRTDHVDLLLVHWPPTDVPLEETMGAMRRLQEAGKTRHVGVSNFTPSLLAEAGRHADVFALQVEYHPFLAQPRLLEATRAADQLLTAYSPLARGKVLKDPTLQQTGRAHDKSPAQVTLRWLLQQSVSAIPKAASNEHRRANLDILDFHLDDDEMDRIHALAREERLIDPGWGPVWER